MRHAAAQAGPSLTMLTRCRLSIRRSRAPREPADPLQGVCAVPIAGPERDRPGVFRHRRGIAITISGILTTGGADFVATASAGLAAGSGTALTGTSWVSALDHCRS